VDISPLVHIGDGIHVRDIVISDKVRILDDVDNMVVVASRPKVEEVVAAVAAVTEEAVAVAPAGPPLQKFLWNAARRKKKARKKEKKKAKRRSSLFYTSKTPRFLWGVFSFSLRPITDPGFKKIHCHPCRRAPQQLAIIRMIDNDASIPNREPNCHRLDGCASHSSGIVNTRATSAFSTRKTYGHWITPTTGVTRKCVIVIMVASLPNILTSLGFMPTSSCASRKAVCSGVVSPSSQAPARKETCPLWLST